MWNPPNLDLDDLKGNGASPYRETGASMSFFISYTNYVNWKGTSRVSYTYTPKAVKGSSYKYYNPIYSDYRASRTTLNMHGISIQAIPGGTYRVFDFNNLLIQLTTSLTLFAVATVIVDFVALYVLPDKEVYDHYKYELTEDFFDRRAGKTRRQFGHQADEDELGLSDESAGLSLPSDLESALIRPSNENSATGKLL
eukprot:FR739345.1.p1 GENE.FR739345.1~~FR739345.1.p1  ORF type:complete len:197 (-),score=21.62 FR739345.1:238-828(-)